MCKDLYIEFICPFCGKTHGVAVSSEEYNAYGNGALAQEAFKSLTATEREQFISHLCPDCQNEIFGSADDMAGEDCDGDCANCPLCDDCDASDACEDDEDWDDCDDEIGYNPYMGCYDWDC